MSRHARRSGRTRAGGTLAGVLSLLVLLPWTVTTSAAAWIDVEHAHGGVSLVDCAASPGYLSSASATLLGGEVLGVAVAPIAELSGAHAHNPGSGPAVSDADPLAVAALGSVNAQLGGVLRFDLGAEAGALRQVAEADSTGSSWGAAGSVAESGAIDLQQSSPGEPLPRFATLELGAVLDAVLGTGSGGGVSGLSDARLAVGALASAASLDGCAADWTGDVYDSLTRDYLVAGLGLELDSPLTAEVLATTSTGVGTIESLVAALAGDSGLVDSLTASTLSALAPTLSSFSIGTPTTTLALDIDLSGVVGALAATIDDPQGILSIDLAAGTVTVDLAGLLGPAYEDSVGLNGLAPNSELLLNSAAASALVSRVDSALTSWIADVATLVEDAADIVTVDLVVTVPLSVGVSALGLTVPVGSISVTVADTALDQLLAGTADIATTLALSPPSCSGITGAVICGVVNPLLTTLTSAVSSLVLDGVLGPVLGATLAGALTPVPGLDSLLSDLGLDADALLALADDSLGSLFGPGAVVSLVVNAQNAPDPLEVSAPPGTEPTWSGLDAGSLDPFTTGEFSVAALRLVTAGMVSGGLAIDLARSSVGPNGPG